MLLFLSIAILVILLLLITSYNNLVRRRNRVKSSFSTVDVMLKKRYDLIPNLVAAVKNFMHHEKNLFAEITLIREQLNGLPAKSDQRAQVENKLSQLTSQLKISMEAYPEIKSDQNVRHLQLSLNDLEEQISAARRVYNNSVREYNNSTETFPSSIIASMFGFSPETFFEIDPIERQNVSVGNLFSS